MELQFNDLPKAFENLQETVNNIHRLLIQKINEQPTETELWFNLQQLCNYLPDKPAKATVYAWVHAGIIPFHKGKKKLRFLKSEIDAWLKLGKGITVAEASKDADLFLSTRVKAGGRKSC